jgi:hypothetical protein
MPCANCHAKEHSELARRNKESSRGGLAGQLREVEQELSVSQEESLHMPLKTNTYQRVKIYDDPADASILFKLIDFISCYCSAEMFTQAI